MSLIHPSKSAHRPSGSFDGYNFWMYNYLLANKKGEKNENLELGKNYIYDGNKNSNSILKLDNLKSTLLKNNPYIGLFIKLD